jgi:hypothetical protein
MSIEHWLMDGIVYSLAVLGLICAWGAERDTGNHR